MDPEICWGIIAVVISFLILFFRSRTGRIIRIIFSDLFRFSHAKCVSTVRLDGKVAIITGSNTGIGKINAEQFCKRGARVIMACRNLQKGEDAARDIREQIANRQNAGSVEVKELDVSSFDSVRRFAKEILLTEKQIHLLINNAGVMQCPRAITKDGYELQLATNHLGHFLLTMLLLPRIISSAPSRVLNIASSAHKAGEINFDDINYERSYDPTISYCRSKLANVLFTIELAKKLEGTGVTTYSLHPGVVRTELFRHTYEQYGTLIQRIWEGPASSLQKSPEQGAQTTLHCSIDEQAGKENGLYYSECRPEELDQVARDKNSAKKLWDLSWNAVGLEKDYNPFVAG